MAFLDWELPNIRRGGRRMSENEISIICNGKNRNSITFNIAVTELVVNKGYTYIQIKQDDVTGEIGFEFTRQSRSSRSKGTLANRKGKKRKHSFRKPIPS